MHAKIDDILEFANIEAGRFPLKEDAVALEGWLYDEWHRYVDPRHAAQKTAIADLGALLVADDPTTKRFKESLTNNTWMVAIGESLSFLPYGYEPREKWVPENAKRLLEDLKTPDEQVDKDE